MGLLMKAHDKNIVNRLSSLFSENEMNKITIMSLFGGAGVYSEGVMFAWFYHDKFYLKGHHSYLTMFLRYNMKPLEFNSGVTVKLLQYYEVTEQLWHDEEKLIKMIQMVIKNSNKIQSYCLKEPRIKDLPNITISLERSLFRVGITTLDSFRQNGSFKCFFKLKESNKNLSYNILYILHSALLGKHVATLTDNEKSRIQKEYHQFAANK